MILGIVRLVSPFMIPETSLKHLVWPDKGKLEDKYGTPESDKGVSLSDLVARSLSSSRNVLEMSV